MATLTVSVTVVDQPPIQIPVKPRTVLAFERHFGVGWTKAFNDDNSKMEYVYWLAWEAMRSDGNVVKPFDAWIETVEEVKLVPKGDAQDG